MYYVENMPFVIEPDGKPRYLFEGHYRELLNADISLINNLLHISKEKLSGIKSPFIPPLNYNRDEDFIGPTNYTFLWLNDKTPTGKVPKYIYTVYFNTFIGDYIKEWTTDTFGQIYYLQNGEIGKVKITMWRNRKLSVIYIKRSNDELIINKVEKKYY